MALLRVDFTSEVLALGTSMTVLLPQRASTQIGLAGHDTGTPPPVLYLLHGLTDDNTAWTRYTSIERYAAARGLAVVMPQVHRSFYADEASGSRFFTFLSEELPDVVSSFFRVSTRREDTFVAGLSMGGYGAFKWALQQPHRFAAAASLSGVVDLAHMQEHDDRPHITDLLARVYGRPIAGTPDDLLHLLPTPKPTSTTDANGGTDGVGGKAGSRPDGMSGEAGARDGGVGGEAGARDGGVGSSGRGEADAVSEADSPANKPALPRLFLRCGTEDHLYAGNQRFVAACRARNIDLDAAFGPGEHEWSYWDTQIQAVLNWLPLKNT